MMNKALTLMPSTLAQIIKLLPSLNSNELEQLVTRAKSLASLGNADQPNSLPARIDDEDSSDEMFVLSCIAHTMQKMGADMTSAGMLRSSREIAAFRSKLPALIRFLDKTGPQRQLRHAVLQLGVRLLYDEIASMDRTVSSRTVMQHIHRLPAALDRQFPGYARSGRLGFILRHHH